MAVFHHDKREIQFKIVYCGTPRSGKTTNLEYIYKKLDPHFRGNLVSIATEGERTIFFDFLAVNSGDVAGYTTKFQLYTVPGQEVYQQTRDTVLAGVDGVVFVADSAPDRQEANEVALSNFRKSLISNGYDPDKVPMAFQFNKRDLPDAVAPYEMDESLEVCVPTFLSSATSGYQVFATLDFVSQIVLRQFHASHVMRSEIVSDKGSRYTGAPATAAVASA